MLVNKLIGEFIKTEHVTTLIAVIAILILGLTLWISVLYPNGASHQNGIGSSITVTAAGTSEQYPSQGVIYLSLNGSGSSAQIAEANLSLSLALVNSSILKYTGYNLSDIQTQYYSVSVVRNSSRYEAVEQLKITIIDSKNISNALSAVAGIKNVYVNGAYAQLSQQQSIIMRNQALSYALDNATKQAEVLADNASLTPINITIGQYRSIISPGVAATSPITQIGTIFYYGNQGLTETVTVTFSRSG